MRLVVKGKNLDVSPALKRLVAARLEKLERRFGEALISADVTLSAEKNRFVVELTAHARQDHTLHGLGATAAWGTSLTAAVQKVLQQAETVKGKWQQRKRGAASVRTLAPVRGRAPRTRRRA